uniref:NACHT domain-containing protein n=1 Tax=Clytia hemisphaerica TaxID=252671 RepID=A0A7M5V858_9CNID
MFTFKWAKEELKTDIKVDFLFKFTCRELNNLSSKFSNLEELFKLNVKYKDIFRDITFDDLMEISDRVLVVIDGVDELKDIYLMGNPSCKNQLILDLIDPKAIWLPNHKSIVCGRPKACELVKRQFKCYHKTIEVCGFSEENVNNYIKKFFGEHYEQKGVAVQKLIESSYNLRSLSRVPVFLWVICNIYKEDKITAPINTYTELCFYSCLILLKKHFGEKSKNFTKLMDVVLDQDIMQVLHSIVVLSVKTYMDNKVVFTEDDIKSLNYSYHLEETGFITKYEGTNDIEPNYQFRHLVLQEFLCSLYICITKGISSYYLSNRELSSCKPTILGIHRLLRMKDNNLFLKFYDSLTKINESHSSYLSKMSRPFNILWFNRFVMKNTLEVPDQMIKGEKLVISTFNPVCSEFLAFYKESNIHELNVPTITSVDILLLSSYKDYKNIGNLIKDLGINNNITIQEGFHPNYIAIDNLSFAQLALGKEYDVKIFPIYDSSNVRERASNVRERVFYERSKATLILDVEARNAPILTSEGLPYGTNRYLRGEIVKNARNVYLDYDGLGNIRTLRTISAIIEVLAKEYSCRKILISSRVYEMCNESIDESARS